jgi:hypothetical protein
MPNGVAAGQHGAPPPRAIAGFNSREMNPKIHRFVEIAMRDCIIIVLAFQFVRILPVSATKRWRQADNDPPTTIRRQRSADNDPPTTIRCFVSPRLFHDGYPCLYIDVSAV